MQAKGRSTARQWELAIAGEFLSWWRSSGLEAEQLQTFGKAIQETLKRDIERGDLALLISASLPRALAACDELTFNDLADAWAYTCLHLLDRYARGRLVLEQLLRCGRLPLRDGGALALEVGAGPSPMLFATHDFYSAFHQWPANTRTQVKPLRAFHSVDRGAAWDLVLHHLSEGLIQVRRTANSQGALGFKRTIEDFRAFDVRAAHHAAIREKAADIVAAFDRNSEYISRGMARQMAQDEGVAAPSAYDLIFLCNFLTQTEMTVHFRVELQRLSRSLTPGGVLVVLGSASPRYESIYSAVREIALSSRLRELDAAAVYNIRSQPMTHSIVAKHVRGNIDGVLRRVSTAAANQTSEQLPSDLTDESIEFGCPDFKTLLFVRHTKGAWINAHLTNQ